MNIENHLKHADQLEVSTYRRVDRLATRPPGSITVDCPQCGVVVLELYNSRDGHEETIREHVKRWRRGAVKRSRPMKGDRK